ncbi:tripartite tricarboxylate transporter substrate-binding protein [Rhodoplanes sp. TEM]|uniref:Tripartite tricarboxylate transporter substrate-binding protein n=1 Tax=Rhodoplanes tepidamans TaxID=200616 RepID=A0ABT5JA13_RHOTP|nr:MULTISPECIES: tripartite tricarboxylate transporter substrate-binding protein [Rhodoplanes]MDC7786417.1 tripartite tricarboxylate transporter substrate-binding protein [Rhodoplanes tepidamans]MDC7985741.1 tripartite tricarboxylate transporter substrate-binding protein [Rhodoplanes sp. TEM]MDQ0357302.1 tripartite-type tricarboxylate transporter receptor subunit TctC [Rhodoplanes tepidamans]
MNVIRALAVALVAVPAMAAAASAQSFPNRPITMVMPYSAGGPGDTITRLVAQGMTQTLKQQIVVDNTSGAGGSIGSAKVAQSAPDGHTLLMIHVSHATNPALYPKLPYDPIKDFEPIGLVVDLPAAFVARKDLPPRTFSEFLGYVKANGAKVNFAHAGIGSSAHLCGLLFASATGVEITSVPYRGAGPALNDMMGGRVDAMCDQIVNVVRHVEAGAIKGYAVTGSETAAALPNLPTVATAGLPGFTYQVWYGLFAPKGTPKPVIDTLVAALNVALKDPTIKARLAELGADTVSPERARPEALAAHLKAEIDKWGPVIKAAGVVGAQ